MVRGIRIRGRSSHPGHAPSRPLLRLVPHVVAIRIKDVNLIVIVIVIVTVSA
jgi:hypothetical protein